MGSSMVLKGLHCSSMAASNSLVIHSHGSGSLHTETCLTGGCQVLSLSRPRKQEGGAGRTLTYISLPDVFHADDPHRQQMAWRWSLLLVKRKVKSPLKDHLETGDAGRPLHTCLPAHLAATSMLFRHGLFWLVPVLHGSL